MTTISDAGAAPVLLTVITNDAPSSRRARAAMTKYPPTNLVGWNRLMTRPVAKRRPHTAPSPHHVRPLQISIATSNQS